MRNCLIAFIPQKFKSMHLAWILLGDGKPWKTCVTPFLESWLKGVLNFVFNHPNGIIVVIVHCYINGTITVGKWWNLLVRWPNLLFMLVGNDDKWALEKYNLLRFLC